MDSARTSVKGDLKAYLYEILENLWINIQTEKVKKVNYCLTAGITPAAPLVGEVTILPPAAFT